MENTPSDVSIGAALGDEFVAITALLKSRGLPVDDLTAAALVHFLVARGDGRIVGVVGLEAYPPVGLLRSLAVHPAWERRGIGGMLVNAMERHARSCGIDRLYLLTSTAAAFFEARGYQLVPRESAPAPIQGTREFLDLCSTRDVCLSKQLPG